MLARIRDRVTCALRSDTYDSNSLSARGVPMNLYEKLLAQKKGVAQLIHSLFGDNGAELASILESELGEQIRYDHREVAASELDTQWGAIPTISSLIGHGGPEDINALKASSYAFRLMALAQCWVRCSIETSQKLETMLDSFGLGPTEVAGYAKDFVKRT